MKFSEEYSFNCVTIKNYFRLPIIATKSNYFINDGTNSIIKIQEQKLTHSWTLEHPHCFTSPVALSRVDNSLFCIIDNMILLKWCLSDETLKEASKFEFQEAVFAVLPLEKHRPLILFSSGKVLQTELLHVSLEPMGTHFISENEELVWADALVIHSDVKVVCLGISKAQKIYRLHCFSVGKKGVKDYSCQLIENADHVLRNWCLDTYNFSFVAIWSNGLISSHFFHTQVQPLLTVRNVESDHLIAIGVIDADHVLVSFSDASRKETVLEMWDTKFSSVKAKKVLKTASSECHQLKIIKSTIFLSLNDNLLEVPFNVKRSTLATALGKSMEVSSNSEFNWKASTLATAVEKDTNKSINSKIGWNREKLQELPDKQSSTKQMDVDETPNPIELLAQRFMEEGSAFKTNNRESDLLQLLRFALKTKMKTKEKCDIEGDALLNSIFTSTFRDSTLVQYIRKLSFEETMITLKSLLDFLDGNIAISHIAKDKPSDSQLFDWLFILMKSHTEALLLSKDKKTIKLLKKMDQCLSKKVEEYEDYVNLQNMFYVLQKKENILPTKHVVGRYFIELLDL